MNICGHHPSILMEDTRIKAHELEPLIHEYCQGLLFDDLGSEAAQPIEVFFQPAALEALTFEAFVEIMGLDQQNPAEKVENFEPVYEVLDGLRDAYIGTAYEDSSNDLVDLMLGHLEDLCLFIVGEDFNEEVDDMHPIYLVGLSVDGNIIGLKSKVLWT